MLHLGVRAMVKVRFRVYLLRLVGFHNAYCTHSRRALLLCHRWHMNKFANFKIHRRIGRSLPKTNTTLQQCSEQHRR